MPRGRTFDKASAVDAAIDLFWSRGFAGVSMQDIAEATGVGNGSLYLAFGSKRALFLAAFRAYCERRPHPPTTSSRGTSPRWSTTAPAIRSDAGAF